jgi:multidrug efflux pump subunit AcrA (membrane-fusion protein)
MASEPSSVNPEAVEQAKAQIRGLIHEISELSRSEMEPSQFYSEYLQRLISAMAAVGGAIWTIADGNRPKLEYQVNLSRRLLESGTDEGARHARLLHQVLQAGEAKMVPPQSSSGEDSNVGNPTRFLLLVVPLRSHDQVEGLVEIFQRPDTSPEMQRGYLRFVTQMAELAGNWLKTHKLRQYSDRHSLWADVDRYARVVHDSLDRRETAYTIANEARQLIGCDRVSVALPSGGRFVVEAVSGQDQPNDRSNVVSLLGRLATKVVAAGDPLWYAGDTTDLPPEIEESLEEYIDESHALVVAVVPLRKPKPGQGAAEVADPSRDRDETTGDGEIVGALILEQIETNLPRTTLLQRTELVREHTARALANSLEHHSFFLMPVWRALGKASWVVKARNLPKTLLALGVVLAVIIGLAVIPKDFNLKARGTLQPVDRMDVFAPDSGDVVEVAVRHGDAVTAGQTLAVLRNTDLEVRLVEITGLRQVASEQLESTRRALLDQPNMTPEERNRLGGQAAQLRHRFASLQLQHELLLKKRERLRVASPIAGKVITWNVQDQLLYRPVTTGQVLLTVADTSGPWELEVYMPENRMGHVASSLRKDGPNLPVTYILASDPATARYGKIKEVHTASNLHDEQGQSVRIRVEIDAKDLNDPRPGASVTATVYCGRVSLGYWLFHEILETIQSEVIFRFS